MSHRLWTIRITFMKNYRKILLVENLHNNYCLRVTIRSTNRNFEIKHVTVYTSTRLLLFTNNTHVTHLSLVKHVCKVSHTSHIRHTHTRHTHNTHHTPLCHTRHTYDTHITHTTHLCTSLTHRCVTVCAVILEWTAGVVGTDDSSSSPLHSQAL